MGNSDIQDLVKSGEGYKIEFKERFTSRIDKEICAFANSSGGRIIIGVSDSNEIAGYELTNQDSSQIHDITRNMEPSLNVDIEQKDNVAIINIPEGDNKPYSVGGKFYLRIGANSQKLSRIEIKNFFQREGIVQFDEKLNDKFDFESDFSEKAFDDFLEKAQIDKIISTKKLLKNIGILKEGKLINAGVLLFCKDISKIFPNANIACVLYQGNSKAKILDQKEFHSDLLSNYQNTMSYLKEKLNTEYVIRSERDEYLELPEDALREAILNAIGHRDYFSNSHIQINIFQNSVEIINPASYPKNITTDRLLKGSHPKNLFLFSLMQRANLVERLGTGITRMKEAMKNYKLEEPEIEYDKVWFRIIFKRPDLDKNSYQDRVLQNKVTDVTTNVTINGTLNDTQKQILEKINQNSEITYSELSDQTNKARRTIVRNMQKLKDKDIVKRVGSRKTGRWEINEDKLDQIQA